MPKNEVKNGKMASEADMKKEVKAAEVSESAPKTTEKTAEAKAPTVKAEEKAAVKEEVKAAVKAEEKEMEEKKAPVKAEAKASAPKKATTKKTAAKASDNKTKTTTTRAKKVNEALYIQYAGKELEVSQIMEQAKAAYQGKASAIKDIKVYVKPEENMAYVVVNGEEAGSVQL